MHRVVGLSAPLMRGAAYALLVALSVAALGPVLHGVHDDKCERAVVIHDARQHHVQAARTSDAGSSNDHCLACHFARASRGPVSWEPSGLTVLADGVLLYHSDGRLIAAPVSVPVPARAPPLV